MHSLLEYLQLSHTQSRCAAQDFYTRVLTSSSLSNVHTNRDGISSFTIDSNSYILIYRRCANEHNIDKMSPPEIQLDGLVI